MRIAVFDSGLGGLSSLSAIMRLLPNHDYLYLADTKYAPYGNKSADFITSRAKKITAFLVGEGAQVVVVACNTATNVCIDELRERFSCKVFGLEPAVVPALKAVNGKVLILLTPLAARQPKFLKLINGPGISGLDKKRLLISPQNQLATIIENGINDLDLLNQSVLDYFLNNPLQLLSIDELVGEESADSANNVHAIHAQGSQSKFVDALKVKGIEAVVLGCSHYCLVGQTMSKLFSLPCFDGNTGLARHIALIAGDSKSNGGGIRFIDTLKYDI